MTENDYIHIKEVESLLEREQGEEISIKELLLRFLYNWKWFVAGTFIMLVLAFLYLRYTTPTYRVTSSIILKEVRNQRMMPPTIRGAEGIQLEALGAVSNLDNEMFVLRSRSTIRDVINRLNLHTSYIVKGRVKSSDLYTNSPVIVSMEQGQLDALKENIEFMLTLNEELTEVTVQGTIGNLDIDTSFTTLPRNCMPR